MKHLILSTLILATAGLLHAGPAPDIPKAPKPETVKTLPLEGKLMVASDDAAPAYSFVYLVKSEADLKAALYEITDLNPVAISQESAECAACHITAARQELLKRMSRRAEDLRAFARTVKRE